MASGEPPDNSQNGTSGGGTLADKFSVFVLATLTVVGAVYAFLVAYLVFTGRITFDYSVVGSFDVGMADDLIYLGIGLAFIEIWGRDKFVALLENWPSKRRGDSE